LTVVRDTRMIDRVTKVVNLYDLYGSLLTKRQRELVEMYYFDDWSLAEIAEHLKISRQAVHDNLRRAEEQLETYEQALKLLESQVKQGKWAQTARSLWAQAREFVPEPLRSEFENALDMLTDSERPAERGDERA
jgi:predicted DNA-binding protein YlxM (UPF0122 family)